MHMHTHTDTRETSTHCMGTEELSLSTREWYWGKTTEKYQEDFPAKSRCYFSKAGPLHIQSTFYGFD